MKLLKQVFKYTVFLLAIASISSAQQASGARLTAMANASVAVQDLWNGDSNPAGLLYTGRLTLCAAHEIRFNNPGLATSAAVLLLPYKQDVWALSIRQYGFAEYSEQKAVIAYSKQLSRNLSGGLQFTYHMLGIQGYGSANALTAGAGLQYILSDKLAFGAAISNPSGSGYDNVQNSLIPVQLSFGFAYHFSQQLLACASFEKLLAYPTDFNMGLEYKAAQWVVFRTGLSINPLCRYYGIGLAGERFSMDTAVSVYPAMGHSPQISVSYAF